MILQNNTVKIYVREARWVRSLSTGAKQTMGIDVTGLDLLRFARARHGAFGKVATLGRQSLHIPKTKLQRLLNTSSDYEPSEYCEEMLAQFFGASSVESFDNSNYEKASHIVDLNEPLPEGFGGFETVIDFGTLEHVFDFPQALLSVSKLCVPGGQILHLLPANNYCGHGFWQITPELFFSWYSPQNGYQDTEVFLADPNDEETWWKVRTRSEERAPLPGQRPGASGKTHLFVLCRTKKTAAAPLHPYVQQMDIESDGAKSPLPRALNAFIRTKPWLFRITFLLLRIFPVVKIASMGLNCRNPFLTKHDVAELVQ